ncbi:MAG: hypothetical protein NVS4B8_14820 [Herpetosiphon sp.]
MAAHETVDPGYQDPHLILKQPASAERLFPCAVLRRLDIVPRGTQALTLTVTRNDPAA